MRKLSEQELQNVSGGVTRLAPQNGNSVGLPVRPYSPLFSKKISRKRIAPAFQDIEPRKNEAKPEPCETQTSSNP